MSELSSRPAREPVVYTLEQVATIPEKQWHAFVLAVTETFWQLPEALRPQNAYFGSLSRASELFPVTDILAFYSRSADGLWSVNVTIEREHRQNILVLKELNFGRQPGDFFARTVFVLLHNLCPDCFRIHSTAGGANWSLPLKWIKRYLGHENFSAPESVLTTPVREMRLTVYCCSFCPVRGDSYPRMTGQHWKRLNISFTGCVHLPVDTDRTPLFLFIYPE